MTQYCRYCSFCIDGDTLFCVNHEKVMTDSEVRRVNHCADFDLSPTGDIFTGRPYTPRKGKPLKAYDGCEQLELMF